ncbi:MAG: hypothetical protein AAGK97_08540, partial [Bacteroidota bacterium]
MASQSKYFWIGGAGNISNPNNWSLSNGGGPAGQIPMWNDTMMFTSNSFSQPNQIVNVDQNMEVEAIFWQDPGFNTGLNFPNGNKLVINLSLGIYDGLQTNYSDNGGWVFRGFQKEATVEVNSNGIDMGNIWIDTWNDTMMVIGDLFTQRTIFNSGLLHIEAPSTMWNDTMMIAPCVAQPCSTKVLSLIGMGMVCGFFDASNHNGSFKFSATEGGIRITDTFKSPCETRGSSDCMLGTMDLFFESPNARVFNDTILVVAPDMRFLNLMSNDVPNIIFDGNVEADVLNFGDLDNLIFGWNDTMMIRDRFDVVDAVFKSSQTGQPFYLNALNTNVCLGELDVKDMNAIGNGVVHAAEGDDLGGNSGFSFGLPLVNDTLFFIPGGNNVWKAPANWSMKSGGCPINVFNDTILIFRFDQHSTYEENIEIQIDSFFNMETLLMKDIGKKVNFFISDS